MQLPRDPPALVILRAEQILGELPQGLGSFAGNLPIAQTFREAEKLGRVRSGREWPFWNDWLSLTL